MEPMEISVEPVRDGDVAAAVAAAAQPPVTFRSSVELQVNATPPPTPSQQQRPLPPPTSPGQRGSFTLSQPPMPRMQART